MAKYLVIVESPAKVKTIKKFLGSNYDVMASMGHVRDLPKSSLGIDVENGFEPKYITIRGKGELLASLRKAARKAERIYLATDPDREGEAISWHLIYALGLDKDLSRVYRITFNEITKNAVKSSISNAREIDMKLVDAQQARRCLDRVVGYQISPILWGKIKRGLSAGRVQSAALKIVCDREDEINDFIPREYWTIDALLSQDRSEVKDAKTSASAKKSSKKAAGVVVAQYSAELESGDAAKALEKELKSSDFYIDSIKRSERSRKAPLPFTTSTLQQEAGKTLNFATSKTMRVAQQLYEGVDIKGHGTVALITYLRTDSTRVSDEAAAKAADYIDDNFGKEYRGTAAAKQKSGSKVQDAHEAIRPTDLGISPEQLKGVISNDLYKLYRLIWRRFLMSQMAAAKYDTVVVKIKAGRHQFSASSSRLEFEGFLKVDDMDREKEENVALFDFSKDTVLHLDSLDSKQHFTQAPPHFTESSLVKALEDEGIGRPSTYAPTISTILARHYVTKEGKNIFVTELGDAVNNMLKEAFPDIVDTGFTADMEKRLDQVEEGGVLWKDILSGFYPEFEKSLKKAEKELEHVSIADEVTDEVCEFCGKNMVIKYGRAGKFLACPGFPDCRNARPYYEKTGVMCPKCGRDIVMKSTRKGRKFFGCMGYPECDFSMWQKPIAEKCPKCGYPLMEKGKNKVCSNQECDYSKADVAVNVSE